MRKPVRFTGFTFLLLSCTALASEPQASRLLRFPDIHQNRIAFVYAGDIWTVPAEGGTARRLTSHPGMELFPKFSPDGKWIAFSGEYTGSRQVFIISVDGGQPRQLTYYNDVGTMPPRGGYDYRILDWTPDGKYVLFRGNRLPWGIRMGRYFKVPVDGGLEIPLPIPEGGGGMLSPDGSEMVYTPIDREFRTWKRYRGGRAQDVWIYDLENNKARQITDFEGTDNQPVWIGDRIYFTSDRDYTLNLFAYSLRDSVIRKVTSRDDFDVLWPSAGPQQIVYECGGYLYRFDPATEQSFKINVVIYGDFPNTNPYYKNVKDFIHFCDISPTGKRALFQARGDIFTVPAKYGEIKNLTQTPGIREIHPAWSPDGRQLAFFCDRTGEYELYIAGTDIGSNARRITRDLNTWPFLPRWSPDSKWLAFSTHNRILYLADSGTGKLIEVDHSLFDDIRHYRWSPDSKWLVYTKQADTQMDVIWLYSLDDKKSYAITDPLASNFEPVFSPDGKYLYFLSNRDFNLTFSDWEFSYLYTEPTRIYIAALNASVEAPFMPRSDEEVPGSTETKEEKTNDKKSRDQHPVRIDIEDFERRIAAVPGPSGIYRDLVAIEGGIAYIREDNERAVLYLFNLEDREEKTVLEEIGDFAVSRDMKKLIFQKNGQYGIAELKPALNSSDGLLDLKTMEMRIDPRAEWRQIFADGWRLLRDWFYDPNMHGLNWQDIRKKYEPLVAHVAHRADLDYIFGEMGGELCSGHVYVQPGDYPEIPRIDNGLLGAELTADPSGYYRIARILPGENWHENFRSPLTVPGVRAAEGDFLLAVNGHPVRTTDNPYSFFENKAGQVVTLTLGKAPSSKDTWQTDITPVKRETDLRYLDWIQSRRDMVDRMSGGRIGYIHMPNTADEGNRELFKYFYPQTKKEALIVDVRYNGGGFIPERMIELLDRPLLNYWTRRNVQPVSTPGFTHQGPKVCLINAYSSSGGDAFPYYFRKRGLGPLIGERTWGGLIGLSGNPGFIDGGSITVPTFRFLTEQGKWDIENIGVSPDIEVLDRPDLVAMGKDPTLEKAVEVLIQKLDENPPESLQIPLPPDKFR